jgi:hypothetical protein
MQKTDHSGMKKAPAVMADAVWIFYYCCHADNLDL